MVPSTIRKAIGAVKDQTSIGLAKVNSSNSLSSLHVAIVKATRHDEHPADERHVREILILTGRSRAYIGACVASLSLRLGNTRSWAVALKTLALVRRLLTEGDPTYEKEIFLATRRGTRMLDVSDFRDASRSAASWDFSAFVRTFARYLDECLEFRMHGRRQRGGRRAGRGRNSCWEEEEEEREEQEPAEVTSGATPVRDMKTERISVRTQHLQLLLDRFLACRPTGAAKNSRLVAIALYPLVKESYLIYFDIAEIISIFVERFMTLPVLDCVRIYDIFSRLSKQLEELDLFYNWYKSAGISRPSEFPEVEGITTKQLEVMDEFIQRRSVMTQSKKFKSLEPRRNPPEEPKPEEGTGYEMAGIKALPPPKEEEEEEENKGGDETGGNKRVVEEEWDLLNLKEEVVTGEEHGEKLALALFDGNPAATAEAPAWGAFDFAESSDWETALVQSASNLSGQRAALGGGFYMLLLDGMYSQAAGAAAGVVGGSASSMAASAVAPGLLALPAPPQAAKGGGDPFAASLAVAPPSWVQMTEMERKQQLLAEEQRMWQQYVQDGMRGPLGMAKLQPWPHQTGGYTQMF